MSDERQASERNAVAECIRLLTTFHVPHYNNCAFVLWKDGVCRCGAGRIKALHRDIAAALTGSIIPDEQAAPCTDDEFAGGIIPNPERLRNLADRILNMADGRADRDPASLRREAEYIRSLASGALSSSPLAPTQEGA